jgi:hypothetical protein
MAALRQQMQHGGQPLSEGAVHANRVCAVFNKSEADWLFPDLAK